VRACVFVCALSIRRRATALDIYVLDKVQDYHFCYIFFNTSDTSERATGERQGGREREREKWRIDRKIDRDILMYLGSQTLLAPPRGARSPDVGVTSTAAAAAVKVEIPTHSCHQSSSSLCVWMYVCMRACWCDFSSVHTK
jgi:hypothetical protein